MESKKKPNLFLKILNILLFVFIIIYCLNISGYYESKKQKETIYTKNQIEQFEQDVKNGEILDESAYLNVEEKNYNNKLTKFSDKLGSFASGVFANGLKDSWKIIKTLFW